MSASRAPQRRVDHRAALERSEPFDLLVVGGGATGAGIALDAVSRGLSVALIERFDLSSGTSSRSTKLIHGGVRYLEKAVKQLDRTQFALVRDALHERAVLIRNAPHLCHPLPLVTPLYSLFQVPYVLTGLKLYDLLAGRANLRPSRFVGAREAKRRFPQLKAEGLRGGVVYYDGQFDDARMNVAIALTAAERGAVVVTHAEVTALHHEDGRVAGATVTDRLDGSVVELAARAIVNAAGPYVDAVRRLDDPDVVPMLTASSGVHVVLDARFAPPDTGLLIPETDDGRVLFLLPWLGHTLVGTTDQSASVVDEPRATEEEIDYILRHVARYFDLPIERGDVRSAWSGLRPLVTDPKAADTAGASRDHVVHVAASGLVTIAGGKWTTYRRMAADAVAAAIDAAGLQPSGPSATVDVRLVGGERFDPEGAAALQARGFDADVAQHLHWAYGDRANQVATLAEAGLAERLAPGHPFIEAEVRYALRSELAVTTEDVLHRRLRLAFLDADAARTATPRVEALLAQEA